MASSSFRSASDVPLISSFIVCWCLTAAPMHICRNLVEFYNVRAPSVAASAGRGWRFPRNFTCKNTAGPLFVVHTFLNSSRQPPAAPARSVSTSRRQIKKTFPITDKTIFFLLAKACSRSRMLGVRRQQTHTAPVSQ